MTDKKEEEKKQLNQQDVDLLQLTLQLRNKQNEEKYAKFHGDNLIGSKVAPKVGTWEDVKSVIQPSNWPALARSVYGYATGGGLDPQDLAQLAGSVSDYSVARQKFIDGNVKEKYDKMLHPPLTYLGDAFQYRTADGKFNSAINPHLGQAGAPYAKTVPSKTAMLGALPDPAELFDKLMAREDGGRESQSGLSAMLIYHATIIIHDIFRTNDNDKNISDSSSYLDLSPLYGFTTEMQRKIRDDKYKLGLLKPDTFAEDRLLRQPPGVCIMLVMYNRYHNYAARQLLRINENGRFSIPEKYAKTKLVSVVKEFLNDPDGPYYTGSGLSADALKLCGEYEERWRDAQAAMPREAPEPPPVLPHETPAETKARKAAEEKQREARAKMEEFKNSPENKRVEELEAQLNALLNARKSQLDSPEEFETKRAEFELAWQAAWDKLDDDLFNTARLITCGMYIQISVHDYLRALMGFHQFDTNFTLDPRADFDQKKTSRGIGNQVTVEFNLLYRFHCAISLKDEAYTVDFMKSMGFQDPENTSLSDFFMLMKMGKEKAEADKKNGKKGPEPWQVEFGIPDKTRADGGVCEGDNNNNNNDDNENSKKSRQFKRNPVTNLFDDSQMLEALTAAMDDPISNFGPRNVPKCLKAVEIMGIMQARKWEVGTLNDFRDFFGLPRHETFESVTKNPEIQNALRDLYENPDKIELYPGIFCESDEYMGLDPGPRETSSALWTAIFSDAITLVRSDRFYTVDWNTNSLTSWGMKEVTPNNEICKSSVFHRLIQRAFPGWFPPDTIRFFHPFYTAKQNAIYAEAQGYSDKFLETAGERPAGEPVAAEKVQKPEKPKYVTEYGDILSILVGEKSKNFTNPAYYYKTDLPPAVRDVLDPTQPAPVVNLGRLEEYVGKVEKDLETYLDDLMRYIVKRESVAVTNSSFQIDVTRDFAIPVVTRYVADFLGFGHKLRNDATETSDDTYSENEIYQHITNCQVFLAYSADETKWMARRHAFQTSMEKLMDLAHRGTIWEASQWNIRRALFGKKKNNAMTALGDFVAKEVLSYEPDRTKAAAILLLVCLDFAYNAVVSFTATLDEYMKGLYDAANTPATSEATTKAKPTPDAVPEWIKVQNCVFNVKNRSNIPSSASVDVDANLEGMIQQTARCALLQPIVRKALKPHEYEFASSTAANGKCEKVTIKKGDTVVLDLAAAEVKVQGDKDKVDFLTSQLNIADKFRVFSPRHFATVSLTSMIRFVAQMRNPRRGRDTQGRLKRVRLDDTPEGYANYMAPMRVKWIRKQAERVGGAEGRLIYTDQLLKPRSVTYLTPTWDEFVPFPMTWKIRFDGFGRSDYSDGPGKPYGKVATVRRRWDYLPPWYQPQGPSTVGGTFATLACICAGAGAESKSTKPGVGADSKKAGGQVEQDKPHCPCLGHHHSEKKFAPQPVQLTTGCGLDVAR